MADWQVEFAIVPRRALATTPRVSLPQLLDRDWWSAERVPAELAQQLAAIAPGGASSSTADVQTWGPEDGNRIEVRFEQGKATRMIARVDVRRLDAKFGAMLIQFARIADAVFVRADGLVVAPLVGAFGAALRSSTAWRFATGPATWDAQREVEEDE